MTPLVKNSSCCVSSNTHLWKYCRRVVRRSPAPPRATRGSRASARARGARAFGDGLLAARLVRPLARSLQSVARGSRGSRHVRSGQRLVVVEAAIWCVRPRAGRRAGALRARAAAHQAKQRKPAAHFSGTRAGERSMSHTTHRGGAVQHYFDSAEQQRLPGPAPCRNTLAWIRRSRARCPCPRGVRP